jgi:outer membrane lipoprotein-sorting protein
MNSRRHSRRQLAAAIAMPWAVLAGTALPAGPPARIDERVPAAPMVEMFLERLSSAAGLQARFTQVNRWAVIDEADSAGGVLTLVPPQRFRLEYAHPRGHQVGCDGRYVWTFIPEERQVLRADVSATTGWGDFFLRAFYEGADSMATVSTRADGRRAARLILGPRPEWGVQSMDVTLDADRGVPLAYAYVDEEGNRYQFSFEEVSFPAHLPDSLFHFAVPRGYELVDVD